MVFRRTARALLITTFCILYVVSFGCSGSSNEIAPDFILPNVAGSEFSLSSLLDEHEHIVIVFYRGHF